MEVELGRVLLAARREEWASMRALMEKLRAKADSQKTLADTSKIVRIVLVMNSGSNSIKLNPSLY